MNAKLDILTRLQAAKTPGRGGPVAYRQRNESLTPSTAYDDSDEEDVDESLRAEEEAEAGAAADCGEQLGDEDDEGTNDSEEVERMLVPGVEDTDVSRRRGGSPTDPRHRN